jgi:hypothetical protein
MVQYACGNAGRRMPSGGRKFRAPSTGLLARCSSRASGYGQVSISAADAPSVLHGEYQGADAMHGTTVDAKAPPIEEPPPPGREAAHPLTG